MTSRTYYNPNMNPNISYSNPSIYDQIGNLTANICAPLTLIDTSNRNSNNNCIDKHSAGSYKSQTFWVRPNSSGEYLPRQGESFQKGSFFVIRKYGMICWETV